MIWDILGDIRMIFFIKVDLNFEMVGKECYV